MPILRIRWVWVYVSLLGCDFTRFSEEASNACAPDAFCSPDGGTLGATETAPDTGTDNPDPTPSTSEATGPTGEPDAPDSECEEPSIDHVRAYFEVPGAEGGQPGDYFRLPFPNDFYLNGDQVSLGAFPRVTATAGAFVDAVNDVADGFSASPTLIFRFSGKVKFNDTLIPRFHVLDITDPGAPSSPPLRLLFSPQGGKYVCHDWLAARPAPGHALIPGHTYAAWIDKGVLADNGVEVERSEHFAAMLDEAAPADPVLATLHVKYEPLRTYLAATAGDPNQLLSGSVFTVGNVRTPMQDLASRVNALAAPTTDSWVRCEQGVVSPCADASGERACGPITEAYEEYHGLVTLPIFQQGTAPYFSQGGQIDTQQVVRSEQVCISLTVPKGAPPAGGFAVVVAAHGAGGSFRSHVRPTVAGSLSAASAADGSVVPFAVLGYDGVQHGPRRGNDPLASGVDPDLLLFNFLNPVGTLGTSLQGGVDVLSVTKAARNLALPPAVTGRADLSFDADAVYFWGHSQGAMQGAIALPYSDDVAAAVFTGLGAGFLQTLLLRKQPALIPETVGKAVADPDPGGDLVFGGEYHPALSLVQQLVDPADPLHHAKQLLAEGAGAPLHVFQVYGAQDAFAPGIAQHSFAIAADLAVVQTDASATLSEDIGSVDPRFPLSGNVSVGGESFTAGVRQYGPPAGGNGHFVAYEVPAAGLDIAAFLAMAASGQTPQIGR